MAADDGDDDDDAFELSQPLSSFTFKHLNALQRRSPARDGPLRVVAHVDGDAFYSQVELVRLGLDHDTPLAVQQWQGLIAINYAAREYGISRHETVTEALKKCPDLVLAHVQTWKAGDSEPRYHESPDITQHKVSLGPYREASYKIMQIMQKHCNRVEKASVDESFLDLSVEVHRILLERFPELRHSPPDSSRRLPPAPFVNWREEHGIVVPGKDDGEESSTNDWDDVVFSIAAELIQQIRKEVFEDLGYTVSAGISRNKVLSKLASGFKKPNKQTVVRNSAVFSFLTNFSFTKIWSLGGKFGESAVKELDTDRLDKVWKYTADELRARLGQAAGSLFYCLCRGIDYSEVNSRVDIKSMMSSKTFRPDIRSAEQADAWLRVLSADLALRVSEDQLHRTPKTLTLHHRARVGSRSCQVMVPVVKKIVADFIFKLATQLMRQVESEGNAYPCVLLALGVGGFDKPEDDNQNIGQYFLRDKSFTPDNMTLRGGTQSALLRGQQSSQSAITPDEETDTSCFDIDPESSLQFTGDMEKESVDDDLSQVCVRCRPTRRIPIDKLQEHDDYHFALELSRQHRASHTSAPTVTKREGAQTPNRNSKRAKDSRQQVLKFK